MIDIKETLDKAKTNALFALMSKCQSHQKYNCKIETVSRGNGSFKIEFLWLYSQDLW